MSKDELIAELTDLRQKISEMEKFKAKFNRVQNMMRDAVMRANDEKAKSDAIISALGDGISIQDIHYKVLYQNDRHKQLVGDHLGEYCYKAYQKKEKICDGCHLRLSFKDGKVHKKEQSRTTDRGMQYVEIISSPLHNSRGEIIAGIESVRDITDRKLAEMRNEKLMSDLKTALESIKTLSGLLPICSWCKKVRDDNGYWKQVERYIEEHTDASFTHGICPDCMERVKKEEESEDQPHHSCQ